MQRRTFDENGFGVISVLVTLVVLIGVVGGGAYVYHRNHKTTATTTGSSQKGSSDTNTTGTSTNKPDPYAGWKVYCDATYHYCFKYPGSWQLTATTSSGLGATGGVTILNPAQTVQVAYSNAFVHDSGAVTFTPSVISKLTSANEDLTLVGGYSPAGGLVGNYLPSYRVVDSSFLSTYPLEVGSAAQFPNNAGFTDSGTGSASYQGAFVSKPTTSINTVADAQSWLTSTDTQTSVKVLESLYYQQ